MTPEFAQAVDAIFLYVLDLLERIERNESPQVSEERIRIRGHIDQAEARLGKRKDWELAKYALVVWTDDVLINAPWDGRKWWEENVLEVEVFNTRESFTVFYTKAEEAAQLSKKEALEVFYVCVVLGFQGLYRDPSTATMAEQLGLPDNLESWARNTAMAIRLGQGRPPITEITRPGQGAPPLEGKFNLVGMTLASVVLAALTVIIGWTLLVPGAS
jgi:type VI secretion system protein ImpK